MPVLLYKAEGEAKMKKRINTNGKVAMIVGSERLLHKNEIWGRLFCSRAESDIGLCSLKNTEKGWVDGVSL